MMTDINIYLYNHLCSEWKCPPQFPYLICSLKDCLIRIGMCGLFGESVFTEGRICCFKKKKLTPFLVYTLPSACGSDCELSASSLTVWHLYCSAIRNFIPKSKSSKKLSSVNCLGHNILPQQYKSN